MKIVSLITTKERINLNGKGLGSTTNKLRSALVLDWRDEHEEKLNKILGKQSSCGIKGEKRQHTNEVTHEASSRQRSLH